MAKDKVMFLGQEYEFPHELYEYVLYCRKFQADRDQILNTVFYRMEQKVYFFPDAELDQMFHDACRNTIHFLSENEIYDITEDDLLTSNTAYLQFQELQEKAEKQMDAIGKQSDEEYKKGISQAAQTAASQVTGSGYALISSSILAHMAFAAMESSKIKSQEAKARRSMQTAMKALESQKKLTEEQRKHAYVMNHVYPEYLKLTEEFFLQLINRYLFVLEQKHVYAYSSINNYSIRRSSDLLNNLNVVEDKEKVLIQAFKNCPYNVAIYQKLVDFALLDPDTEKTLEYYGQRESLVSSMQDFLKNLLIYVPEYMPDTEKLLAAKNNIRYLLHFLDITQEQLEQQCFPKTREAIKKAVNDLQNLNHTVHDIREFNDIMRKTCCENVQDYVKKIFDSCAAESYAFICGESYFLEIFALNGIKSQTFASYRKDIEEKLNLQYGELWDKKKKEQEAEERRKVQKNKRIKIGIGIAVAAVALYLAGTYAWSSYQRYDINKQCKEVNGSIIPLDIQKFADSKWIKSAEEQIGTNIIYDEDHDFYEWTLNKTVHIIVKDEFERLADNEQYKLKASFTSDASDLSKTIMEDNFPKFCKYYDMADDALSDDWDKLKKIYGNGVFHRGDFSVTVSTENNKN